MHLGRKRRGIIDFIKTNLWARNTEGDDGIAGTPAAAPAGDDVAPGSAFNDGIASATVTPGATETPAFDFSTAVPEAYKEKEWVQNILKSENPQEEFFKQYENAQTLIGKRPQGLTIPGDNATPEEVKAFHKALGVPDTVEGYDIKPTTWDEADKELGEYVNSNRSEGLLKDMKEAFMEEGIPPAKMQRLMEKYDKSFVKHNKEFFTTAIQANTELQADFDKTATEFFGTRKMQVLDAGNKILEATVPEKIQPFLKELDNRSLNIMAAALDSIRAKYIKEDNFGGSGDGGNAVSLDEIKNEGRRLMNLPAYGDPLHVDHDKTVALVNANYERQRNLSKA